MHLLKCGIVSCSASIDLPDFGLSAGVCACQHSLECGIASPPSIHMQLLPAAMQFCQLRFHTSYLPNIADHDEIYLQHKSFSCSFVSNIWANPHPPTRWLSITFGFFVECGMFDALSNLPQDRIMISWLGYFVKPQVNFPLERCAPLVHALINVTSFCHGICLAFPLQMCVSMESVQC